MLGLFRDKYADFTVKHFHEQLQKRHGYVLGYTVTKGCCRFSGRFRSDRLHVGSCIRVLVALD
jgi:hypothetical protein